MENVKKFIVALPQETHAEIKTLAAFHAITMQELLGRLIDKGLIEAKKEPDFLKGFQEDIFQKKVKT